MEVTLQADENLTGTGNSLAAGCTCVSVTGGGTSASTTKLSVSLATPSQGQATFSQTAFPTTGIYGLMVAARDLGANVTRAGAVEVNNEDVSSQITGGNVGTSVSVKLANWPLADSDADGTLADEFSMIVNGTPVAATPTAIEWGEAETVTLTVGQAVNAGDTVSISYNYVRAGQVVQVDVSAPTVAFDPPPGANVSTDSPSLKINASPMAAMPSIS